MARDAMEFPRVSQPARGLKNAMARVALKLGGWSLEGAPPDCDRYVVITAPHTYWWDAVWMIASAWYWGMELSWLVKSTAVRGPFGAFMLKIGAIPVDRSAPQGLVGQLVQAFRERSELILAVPAEGTRERREYWKSGFYHIAREAEVPLCLSVLDYGRKVAGLGEVFMLTGDVRADMDRIRAQYEGAQGRFPEKFTPPRLKEEDAG